MPWQIFSISPRNHVKILQGGGGGGEEEYKPSLIAKNLCDTRAKWCYLWLF